MRVLTISDTHIRPAQPTEHAALVMLWERSVRATHDFLTEADIAFYRPLVAEYFEGSATDTATRHLAEDVVRGLEKPIEGRSARPGPPPLRR